MASRPRRDAILWLFAKQFLVEEMKESWNDTRFTFHRLARLQTLSCP